MVALGDQRPAVITTRLDEVQLIAMGRPHFMGPQPAGAVKGDAQGVTVTEGPKTARQRAPILEWIVDWHPAVIVQADDLAQGVVPALRRILGLAVAGGDEHFAGVATALRTEDNAMSEMSATDHLR